MEPSEKSPNPTATRQALSVPLALRATGALASFLGFCIVVFQVYMSADTASILAGSGVATIENWQWSTQGFTPSHDDDESCIATQCWRTHQAQIAADGVTLPAGDPLGSGQWKTRELALVSYTTRVPRRSLAGYKDPVLYIPGLRAERVYIHVDDVLLTRSVGNLPFFVALGSAAAAAAAAADHESSVKIAITLRTRAAGSFSGFIRKELFFGSSLGVYRAHHNMTNRSFARHASILFLLATGALTFAFFIFLDQKRELFALGLTISLLGVAEAVRVGLVPFLGPPSFFALFALHIACLAWYACELARLESRVARSLCLAPLFVLALYFTTRLFDDSTSTRELRNALLMCLNAFPALAGGLTIGAAWHLRRSDRERALQASIGAASVILYSLYLFASDLQELLPFNLSSLNETPLLLFNATWIVAGLATLGSLERRVQRAVEDQKRRLQLEQELALGEAVQRSFIPTGKLLARDFAVLSVYKAAKSIGGDWVAWRDLKEGYALGIIGDVVGKGLQAGLIVSACDAALEQVLPTLEPTQYEPKEILQKVVTALHLAVIARHPQRAMTMALLLFDATGAVTIVNLGHPPILGIANEGVRLLTSPNSWLNQTFELSQINAKTYQLRPGEVIMGYSDGVCDGSRQLRRFTKQWLGWHEKSLEEFDAELAKLTPDYDDQSLLIVRQLEEQKTESPG